MNAVAERVRGQARANSSTVVWLRARQRGQEVIDSQGLWE